MGAFGTLAYMLMIFSLLLYIKYRIYKIKSLADFSLVETLVHDSIGSIIAEKEPVIIIWLDYNSKIFPKIDPLITDAGDRYIIIFQAPDWLFNLKKRTWRQHILMDANKHALLSDEAAMIRYKSDKLQRYDKPEQFLDYYNAKTKFLHRLDHILQKL